MTDEEKLYILTLELEIEALRSVLSEYDANHGQYTQWLKAESLSDVRWHLRRPQ